MDYAVLMMSDDGYSFLWEQHLDIFFRAWQNFDRDFYICSRTKPYDGKYTDRVKPLPVGAEPSWSKRLLLALDAIAQDYILLTHTVSMPKWRFGTKKRCVLWSEPTKHHGNLRCMVLGVQMALHTASIHGTETER